MTRLPRPQRSFAERAALGLARFVAGRERRRWLEALERELDELDTGRIEWALGGLVAAIKDRAAREWRFGLALAVLPALALLATVPVALASFALFKALGAPQLPGPAALLTPLPFAYLLGRMRPQWNPVLVGFAGFAIYQFAPALAWRALIGPGMWFNWGPNLWQPGLQPVFQLIPATMWMWLAGASLGAKLARDRDAAA